DLVYKNAMLTIVAVAGEGPNHGLPGVGCRLRISQPFEEIGSIQFVSTLPHPVNVIQASNWMTRAWTYQEAIFSPRRLFFTDQQVYFECDSMCCWESLDTCPSSLQRRRNAGAYSGQA